MNVTRRALFATSLLAIAGLTAFGPTQGKPPKDPPVLIWTLDEGYPGNGDWSYATLQAAASTAAGTDGANYTDWRLPTIAELQAALKDAASGKPAGFGGFHPNLPGTLIWSASGSGGTGVGSWAYCCLIYTDGAGNVVAPSGDMIVKEYKNGGHSAKFVRP